MTHKIFFSLLVYIFALGIHVQATNTPDINKVPTQQFLRFIDTKEEYGKLCEEYQYITPKERQKLLKNNNFLFGDMLNDSLPISKNKPNPTIVKQRQGSLNQNNSIFTNLLIDTFSLSVVNPHNIVETNLTNCDMQDVHISESLYKEKVIYLNENIVTIEVYQYKYGAGALHGNRSLTYSIYDREYGMKLDWDSLFGKYGEFDKYIIKRVIDEIASTSFISSFNAENALNNFRLPGHFAIIDEGLLIRYGKYEITPGSGGLPFLIIPREDLKQYMAPQMYKICFASKNTIPKEAGAEYTN